LDGEGASPLAGDETVQEVIAEEEKLTMKVSEKVILVTGASKGIGAASAAELARRGALVVLAARSLQRLEARAAEIRQAGGKADIVHLDVTSDDSVALAIQTVLGRRGRIDTVINNAGDGGKLGLWLDQDRGKLREMLDVHLLGMERVTRAVLPSMLSRGRGTIVNVVSALAWAPMSAATAYCAAKAGVLAFSEALRGELADRGIDVLIFAPGHTKTDAAFPLKTGQILMPEEVARDLARSLEAGRPLFISGISNRNLVRLKRFWPGLAARIITNIGLQAVTQNALSTD
jgi:short-subunit dehydrogenase